jgi:hypothetical protein
MKPKKKQTDDRFQSWWNSIFFYTDKPFYEIYKKLCAAGADLDYILFIHLLVRCVARFDPLVYGKQLRQSRKRKAKAVSKDGFTFDVFTREMERLCFLIDRDVDDPELKNAGPIVIAAEITAMMEQLRQREDARTVELFLKVIQNLLQSRVRMNNRAIQNSLQDSTSTEDREVPRKALMAVCLMINEILAQVCEKFFRLPKKGRQTDLLGNFVLFAVTEHLREKRPGRSRHGLTAEFLRRITADSKTTAASARVRVHKLNRSRNQQDELLSFVNRHYAHFRTIESSARQIAPD